jgi:glutamine cyclotransferase
VLQKKAVGKKYFGEGLTIIEDYIVQLTWKEHTAFVYDKVYGVGDV